MDPLIELRLKLAEDQLKDHERRIRPLELQAAKIAAWSFLGSLIGGSVVAAIIGRVFGG